MLICCACDDSQFQDDQEGEAKNYGKLMRDIMSQQRAAEASGKRKGEGEDAAGADKKKGGIQLQTRLGAAKAGAPGGALNSKQSAQQIQVR
jgi:hypothetical protein